MSVERGVTHPNSGWDSVSHDAPDLRHFPGVEGVKNLTGGAKYLVEEVWRAIRTRFPSLPVSRSDYPPDLQRYAKSLDSHGFFPSTLVPQESGTSVSPDGDFFIDWDKRVIGSR